MKTNLLYALVVLMALSGCSKSEEKEVEPDRLCYLQEELYISGPAGDENMRTVRYTYNDQYQLISTTPSNTIFGTGHTRYSYDADGKMIRIENFDGKNQLEDYTESRYDAAGRVVRWTRFSDKGVERVYIDYTYDNQNNLLESKEYQLVDGSMRMLYHTVFTFQNGNMTKSVTYNETNLKIWEVSMVYDNRKSPLWALPAFRKQLLLDGYPHRHNFLQYTERNKDGKVLELSSYTNTITYTPFGYPQEEIRTYGSLGKVKKVYTYVCP